MRISVSPFLTGLVIGFLGALAQAFLGIAPPEAYGVCMIGHTKDLIGWIDGDFILKTPPSIETPLLTTVGVIVGAFISSLMSKEFKTRCSGKGEMFSHLVYGFLAMNLGLILGGCALSTILKVAYGHLLAIMGIVGVIVGAFLGVEYLKRS